MVRNEGKMNTPYTTGICPQIQLAEEYVYVLKKTCINADAASLTQ